MEPIPDEAREKPSEWASSHIESLQPEAAKEIEYALKFGSDQLRYIAARDALAMKGLTTKPKEANLPANTMTFNFNGPVSSKGAPLLPFMSATKKLAVDNEKAPVIIDAEPVKKEE